MRKTFSDSSSLTITADKQQNTQLVAKSALILIVYLLVGISLGVVYTYLSCGNKIVLIFSSLLAPLVMVFLFFLCLTESVEKQNVKNYKAFIGADVIVFLLSLTMPIIINLAVKNLDIENIDLLLKHKYFSIIYVLIIYLIIYIIKRFLKAT